MGRKIRALIVDDAVAVRKIVSDVLSEDSEIEVAGVAANGKIGLSKIDSLKPDVITLDVEMPEMNGLEMLEELRKRKNKIPVIMFSTLTQRGATATLEALSLGATDYVTKPANVGSVSVAMQRVREELIPKIKALCAKVMDLSPCKPPVVPAPIKPAFQKQAPAVAKVKKPPPKTSPLVRGRVDVLAVGVSTGGPNALAEFLPLLPGNIPVPVVIVQHMPPFFTQLLAARLNEKANVDVAEAQQGDLLKPGKALLAPGDYHMMVEKKLDDTVQVQTNQGPLENSCRPAVDVLFRSVLKVYGANTLAVILTGMGQDGLASCELVKKSGGQIVVQDEETSVVWGMPGFVARAGLAEKILPLDQIAFEVTERLQVGRIWNPE